LGSGPGTNISLFIDLDYRYYSVEGLLSAIQISKERFPYPFICQADFTKILLFQTNTFSMVADRSVITHNKDSADNIFKKFPGLLYLMAYL
jgi:hypothetical protein